MRGKFNDEFAQAYQRSNKRTGQRNLRCFPTHSETGHVGGGFCGRALSASISVSGLAPNVQVMAWGEFVECGQATSLKPGDKLSLADALSKERSRADSLQPWIKGEVSVTQSLNNDDMASDGESMSIVFNRSLVGWHYGWLSTKHTCDAYHCFKAMIFSYEKGKDVTFLGAFTSPTFQLYSRRRRNAKALDAQSTSSGNSSTTTSSKRKGSVLMDSSETSKVKRGKDLEEDTKYDGLHAMAEFDLGEMDDMVLNKQAEAKRNRTLDRLLMYILLYSEPDSIERSDEVLEQQQQQQQQQQNYHDGVYGQFQGYEVDQEQQHYHHHQGLDQDVSLYDSPSYNVSNTQYFGLQGPSLLYGLQQEHDITHSMEAASPVPSSLGTPPHPPNTVDDAAQGTFPSPKPSGEAAKSETDNSNTEYCTADVRRSRMLRSVLLQHTGMDEAAIDELNSDVSILSSAMIQLSIQNDSFAKLYRKYSTTSGLLLLQNQIDKERQDTDFEWSTEHEDESYDILDPSSNLENSIYAQVRHNMRLLVGTALNSTGQTVAYYNEPMELAARHGILMHDAHYPPSKKACMFLHIQLHGNLEMMHKEDYGSRKRRFKDAEQHKRFGRDLLIVKRAVFRRLLCNRLTQHHRNRNTHRSHNPPTERLRDWDCSGTWMALDHAEHDGILTMESVLKAMFKSLGATIFGHLGAQLFVRMFQKLNIVLREESLTILGQQVLMAKPELCIPYSGEPLSFRPSVPIPVPHMLVEHKVTGWLDKDLSGFPRHNFVIASHLPPAHTGPLVSEPNFDQADDHFLNGDSESQLPADLSIGVDALHETYSTDLPQNLSKDIERFLAAAADRAKKSTTDPFAPSSHPQMCQYRQIILTDKDTFTMHHHYFILADGSASILMEDRWALAENMQQAVKGEYDATKCLHVHSFTTKFVRDYIQDDVMELFLPTNFLEPLD